MTFKSAMFSRCPLTTKCYTILVVLCYTRCAICTMAILLYLTLCYLAIIDRKKAEYQSPQRPVAASSQQAASPRSPGIRPNGKKDCPHCGRTHEGTECWKLVGKCLKCGSSEHQIRDYPRLQQRVQCGASAPAAVAAAALATRRPRRPRAQA
ncbi:hypothetical protein Taro_055686 [Colocasia esculenta]|uniref:Uncharacterized protein n=1 Tax=Colocasia esculenta TaxID=4460 RepID=A0A843XU97_COLES|nr:hypothetical protein [Colocasia esculenta]